MIKLYYPTQDSLNVDIVKIGNLCFSVSKTQSEKSLIVHQLSDIEQKNCEIKQTDQLKFDKSLFPIIRDLQANLFDRVLLRILPNFAPSYMGVESPSGLRLHPFLTIKPSVVQYMERAQEIAITMLYEREATTVVAVAMSELGQICKLSEIPSFKTKSLVDKTKIVELLFNNSDSASIAISMLDPSMELFHFAQKEAPNKTWNIRNL